MSETGPDVDGDESDLKECLLETLKADGTLKQIQDQLSAAVYAAFYRQTTQPVERTQSPLNKLVSKQSGITAVSLFVDFLQSLGLKKTLNVLLHETGLGEFEPDPREKLIQRYNLSSIPEKSPILPALLDAFANLSTEPPQLSKAVVLDQDSENGFDKPFHNNGSIPGNLDSNFASPSGVHTSKDQHQRLSPPHFVDYAKKPGDFPREQVGRHDTDKTLSSGVHQSQQQSQWFGRRDLAKEGECVIRTDPTDDRSAYIADAALSGSSPVDHLQETSSSQRSISFANIVTCSPPSSHTGGHSPTATNLSTSVFKPPPQRYPGNISDGDSDIDSEVINDITLSSSKVEDCDYMEPVRRYY